MTPVPPDLAPALPADPRPLAALRGEPLYERGYLDGFQAACAEAVAWMDQQWALILSARERAAVDADPWREVGPC